MNPQPQSFTAWHRPGYRLAWEPIGTAPTEAEAWALAYKVMRSRSGDWQVLPNDQQPRGKIAAVRGDGILAASPEPEPHE